MWNKNSAGNHRSTDCRQNHCGKSIRNRVAFSANARPDFTTILKTLESELSKTDARQLRTGNSFQDKVKRSGSLIRAPLRRARSSSMPCRREIIHHEHRQRMLLLLPPIEGRKTSNDVNVFYMRMYMRRFGSILVLFLLIILHIVRLFVVVIIVVIGGGIATIGFTVFAIGGKLNHFFF